MPSANCPAQQAMVPTAQAGADESRHPKTAQSSPPPHLATAARSETTELERRVLAHERILQALIAQMAESEPQFLARLTDTFYVPMAMIRSEHDYTDTDSYAAAFVRSVVNLGEQTARNASAAAGARPAHRIASPATVRDEKPPAEPAQTQMTHANGIWRVTVDGQFYGDFSKEPDAAAAVAAYRSGVAQSS